MSVSDFEAYVAQGGKVDAMDEMPDEYRQALLKTISFQALAEVVGAQVFAEWLPKAPTFLRKMIYTAKIQDEIGHGHVLMRVCEDLGKSRYEIMEDYFSGRLKLLSVFHYRIEDWLHFPVVSLISNTAAITQFDSLDHGSYLPYDRALKKISKEESFHYHQALDLSRTILRFGTDEERKRLNEGLNIWWPRVLGYFGPSDDSYYRETRSYKYHIKVDSNDTIRQRWIDRIVSVLKRLGLTVDDPLLRKDEQTGRWSYTPPDWEEWKNVSNGHGPFSEYWLQKTKEEYYKHEWVRKLLEEKQAA
ncbi:MAG: 1,2-phenylacetyl-CoA epoxidase subunit A [Firmicutes bacterium]|nr:1,2-phenylacetyl-CoA epoxidase subunit A [Bacillota bacterium]